MHSKSIDAHGNVQNYTEHQSVKDSKGQSSIDDKNYKPERYKKSANNTTYLFKWFNSMTGRLNGSTSKP